MWEPKAVQRLGSGTHREDGAQRAARGKIMKALHTLRSAGNMLQAVGAQEGLYKKADPRNDALRAS